MSRGVGPAFESDCYRTTEYLETLGVSVDWLQHGFLKEVKAAGLDESSTIPAIEPLHSSINGGVGVIRQKGKDVVCPIDGRLGASYVHSLLLEEVKQFSPPAAAAGPASAMLSYGWAYSVGDIIVTLLDYCQTNQLDPTQTYVWICCLCVNQHRVVHDNANDKEVPFEEFQDIFFRRVTGIGHMLAMMSPWHKPWYLTRVWCIFELFTAIEYSTSLQSQTERDNLGIPNDGDKDYKILPRSSSNDMNSVTISIIMPPREKRAMTQAIVEGDGRGIHQLYQTLAQTSIQKAKASHEEDRINILGLVEAGPGSMELNARVNGLLREWVKTSILGELQKVEQNYDCLQHDDGGKPFHSGLSKEEYATFLSNVGTLFRRNGENDQAIQCYRNALEIRSIHSGRHHEDTASSHNNMGLVLQSMGDYFHAEKHHRRAMVIREELFGKCHPATAESYNNLALVVDGKGDYPKAQVLLEQVVRIRKEIYGRNHPSTAAAYDKLGVVLRHQGHYDDALAHHQQCLAIYESLLDNDNVDANGTEEAIIHNTEVSQTYNNIGNIFRIKRQTDDALYYYRRYLRFNQRVHGNEHPDTAESYANVGWALFHKGEYKDALHHCRTAVAIQEAMLGSHHPLTCSTHRLIRLIQTEEDIEV